MSDERKKHSESSDKAVGLENIVDEMPMTQLNTESAFLQQELKAKQEEAKNNYDRFMRQVAELENFKRRASREKQEAIRFANEALVKELLAVIDNLERATAHAESGEHGAPLLDGVAMILKGLLDTLAKHGVVQVSAIGQPFDPQLHEAMAQVESANQEPNTVLEEHQKGYLFKDRLLRPALVTVVKAPDSNTKKTANGLVENSVADD